MSEGGHCHTIVTQASARGGPHCSPSAWIGVRRPFRQRFDRVWGSDDLALLLFVRSSSVRTAVKHFCILRKGALAWPHA
jgi:hypothetical protein